MTPPALLGELKYLIPRHIFFWRLFLINISSLAMCVCDFLVRDLLYLFLDAHVTLLSFSYVLDRRKIPSFLPMPLSRVHQSARCSSQCCSVSLFSRLNFVGSVTAVRALAQLDQFDTIAKFSYLFAHFLDKSYFINLYKQLFERFSFLLL